MAWTTYFYDCCPTHDMWVINCLTYKSEHIKYSKLGEKETMLCYKRIILQQKPCQNQYIGSFKKSIIYLGLFFLIILDGLCKTFRPTNCGSFSISLWRNLCPLLLPHPPPHLLLLLLHLVPLFVHENQYPLGWHPRVKMGINCPTYKLQFRK